MPYVLPDQRRVSPEQAFELGGVQYPRNWLKKSTAEDRSALNITWEADPPAPEPPAPTKDQLIAVAASKRWTIQSGGITLNGAQIDTSTDSLALITGAIESLERGWTTAPIRFKAKNAWLDLSLVDLQGAAAAVSQHVQNCFSAEAAVVAKINNDTYTTVAAVNGASEWPA